jgi:glucose-1-phosphate adenylyltransferase
MDIIRENSGISPEEWEIRPNPEYGGRPMDRAPARFLSCSQVSSSLIAAGCVIEGTVINSVLSPGVRVKKGAVISNSVIFEDCVLEEGAKVDLAILDKRVQVGSGAVVGHGDNLTEVNKAHPKHLYTGISLVGKEAKIPGGVSIGRNCIVNYSYNEDNFHGKNFLADGDSA